MLLFSSWFATLISTILVSSSSFPLDVAEIILKAVKSNNPEIQCLVGIDASSHWKKKNYDR